MNHAGVHWPANAGGEHPNVETILSMPGIGRGCTLLCADSARFWYRQARGACPLVVWRGLPRQGRLPAQLGWNAKRVADECLNLWEEQPHGGIEWFLPLNELNFEKESGGPFPGYAAMASNLDGLRRELRKRLPGVGLLFPAWVPSDDGDHLDEWRSEATQWDAICLHAYGSAEVMRARYRSYRDAFPDTPILVGEWNANHEGHDERAALEMWAEVADGDPAFLGAVYFIWETNNDGERNLSIWGNAARLALFRNPPTVPLKPAPVPVPQPPPVVTPPTPPPPEPAPMPDLHAYARAAAGRGGIDPDLFERQIQQESGFDPNAFNPSGAVGIAQIIPRFHPDVDPHDPLASLDYAAAWMGRLYRQYGSYKKALMAYNWGPGNVQSWNGQPSGMPAETRHYLDVILGPGWPEPDQAPPAPAPQPRVTYNRDLPAVAQNDPWSCSATALRWALTAVGRHPTEGWIESQMKADGIVTEADGLLIATGGPLAAWITSEYGEFGYSANAESPVSFDALAAEFMAPNNPYPGLLGGSAWGHWSGLRSYDPANDCLLLANPANGWQGVGQSMARDQFAALGPFSLVRILHPDLLGAPAPAPAPPQPAPEPVPAPPPAPTDILRAQIAAIRAACDQLEAALP